MRILLALLFIALPLAAETYLVCAGVETYDDPGISPLRYAVADVKAVAATFRDAGVPEGNITLLTSDAADRRNLPTRASLLRALQGARSQARADDTLLFFFSGHGLEKDGEPYLLTFDSNAELLDQTALAMSIINQALRGFQGANLLLVIDACRNDPVAGKAAADAALDESFAKGLRPKLQAREAGEREPNVALLLACEVGQRAWEMPEQALGAFTYWLLQGLLGEAPRTAEQVDLAALAAYLEEQVPAWAKRAGRSQTPRFEQVSGGGFALPAPRRQPAPKAEPTAPVAHPRPAATQGKPAGWPAYLNSFKPRAGMTWSSFRVSPKDGMPQVLIPAGKFTMGTTPGQAQGAQQFQAFVPGGTAAEQPARGVYLSAYWMDLHEVTNEQYCRFLNDRQEAVPSEWFDLADERKWTVFQQILVPGIERQGVVYRPVAGRAGHPVVWVSWDGARAYAQWAGRELPTEAQWEKAARGGQQDWLFVWGDSLPPPPGAGNLEVSPWQGFSANSNFYYSDEYQTTSPVGSFRANDYGLYDAVGNVWEWCRDWYAELWYDNLPARDPLCDWQTGSRVFRGGSWHSSSLWDLRVARRGQMKPTDRNDDLGFRCVEPAPEVAKVP